MWSLHSDLQLIIIVERNKLLIPWYHLALEKCDLNCSWECEALFKYLCVLKQNLRWVNKFFSCFLSTLLSITLYKHGKFFLFLKQNVSSVQSRGSRAALFVKEVYHRKSSVTQMMQYHGWQSEERYFQLIVHGLVNVDKKILVERCRATRQYRTIPIEKHPDTQELL